MSHSNLEALKAHIVKMWETKDPTYIIETCKSFRLRVEKVIADKGVISRMRRVKVSGLIMQTSIWC